jgi:hypothetical protein
MTRKRLLSGASALPLFLGGLYLPAGRTEAADWEWSIIPYVWTTDISMDVTVNDEPVLGGDLAFPDLVDKIDLTGMVHFEGRNGDMGFFVDALYLAVSDDHTTEPRPLLPGGTLVRSDLDTGLYEAGGFFRLLDRGHVLDLLLGVRVIDMERQTDITLPAPSTLATAVDSSETLLDGITGLRYIQPLGDRWNFGIRADLGLGDTEQTWNLLGTAGVRFGKTDKYSLAFGWRHMDIEMEDDDSSGVEIGTDLTLSGPVVGFIFRL